MKRTLKYALWAISIAAVCVFGIVRGGLYSTGEFVDLKLSVRDDTPAARAAADARFPIGRSVSVDFDVRDPLLAELTLREQVDQELDWLLWLVASEVATDQDELNRSLFDVPVVRHGYARPLMRFEYGWTRSTLLGSGAVVALVPRAVEAQRSDDLAYIADEQRKNLGEVPEVLYVFEYELLGPAGAKITRQQDLAGPELFTATFGYVEATITNAEDLAKFMSATDDLVSARIDAESIQLGGRKLRTGYQNIRPMDAAAVWQASAAVQEKRAAVEGELVKFNAEWQIKEDEFNRKWSSTGLYSPGRDAAFQALEQQRDDAYAALMQRVGFVDSIGFSLDPTYDYETLAAILSQPTMSGVLRSMGVPPELVANFEEMLEDELSDAAKRGNAEALMSLTDRFASKFQLVPPSLALTLSVCEIPHTQTIGMVDALRNDEPDIVPLLKIVDILRHPDPSMDDRQADLCMLVAALLDQTEKSARFQSARYDGPLAGTEVGMVLFYTDLTAKLWALDYQRSTPSQPVADFRPMTRIKVSRAYLQEQVDLPSTRLWFGPEDQGYQLASDGELLFSRNATRIYAASSNPLAPGKEVPPNARSEAFLGWWNDHYDAVAHYEPFYQRLNEIMKWSLLNGWLGHAGQTPQLAFLEEADVDRSAWFPAWAAANQQLRFDAWSSVGFHERGYRTSKTESMPILSSEAYEGTDGEKSWFITGGVSLASKDTFKSLTRVPEGIAPTMRRAGFNHASASADELVALRGAKYQFLDTASEGTGAVGPGVSTMRMFAPKEAKLRGRFGDIRNGQFSRTLYATDRGISARLIANDADVGTLSMSRSANGYRVGWHAREMDDGVTLARTMSLSPDPARVIGSSSSVRRAFQVPGTNEFYVQFRGSRRWMQIAPEGEPAANLAEGWAGRAAAVDPRAQTYQFRWHEAGLLPTELAERGAWIRGSAPAHAATPDSIASRNADVYSVADEIVRDPAAWKAARDAAFKAELEFLDDVATHRAELLGDSVHETRRMYGNRPEVSLRVALAELQVGDLEAAAGAINSIKPTSRGAATDALDELNARLRPVAQRIHQDADVLADAADLKASGALRAGDDIAVVAEGDRLVLEGRLAHADMVPVSTRDTLRDGLVFHEDSPAFNNLDWATAPRQVIDQVLDRQIGSVYRVPVGELATYRPQRLRIDGRTYTSSESRVGSTAGRAGANAARTVNAGGGGCGADDPESTSYECNVYVVRAEVAVPTVPLTDDR
jgi:hypothetical protein